MNQTLTALSEIRSIEVDLVENPGSEEFRTDSEEVVDQIGFFPRAEIHLHHARPEHLT
jgi:hypothetical protein